MKVNNDLEQMRELLLTGLILTHKRLIATKKEKNFSLAISENGKVIYLSADKL